MADLFISYSRKDTEFVRTLDAALIRSKYDTWVDWQNIPPTADWWEEIESGIEAAHSFIFILSPDSVASKVCRKEVDHAVKSNKRLIPIVRRDVEAGNVHPELAKINWIHFRKQDDFRSKFFDLVKSIDIDLGHWKSHTTLLTQSVRWEKSNRDSGLLLRGRSLSEAAQWLIQSNANKEPRPTQSQIDYVSASVAARRATNTRQRVTISILGTLLAMAMGAGGVAYAQYKKTERALDTIGNLQAVDRYQGVTARSRQLKQKEFDKGTLLAAATMKGLQRLDAPTGEVSQIVYDSLGLMPPSKSVFNTEESVQEISFSPDGRYLATRSSDNMGKLWDVTEKKLIEQFSSEKISFGPKNRYFVSHHSDQGIVIWSLQESKQVQRFDLPGKNLKDVQFGSDGRYMVAHSDANTATLWDLDSGQQVGGFSPGNTVEKVVFSPQGKYLATLHSGNRVTIWNVQTAKQEHDRPYIGTAYDVRFSPNDRYFAYRVSDTEIWVQDLQDSTNHSRIRHIGNVKDIRFSPKSPYVTNRYTNEVVRLWDLQATKSVDRIEHQGSVEGVSFSPDGRYLAVSGQDNTAIVWDLDQRKQAIAIFHDNKVEDIRFSPGSKYLATRTTGTQSMRVWDIANDIEAARIAHTGNVTDFSFSPDGRYIATGSEDKTVKVWDLERNEEVARISHDRAITNLSFSADGQSLATGSADKTARVWDLSLQSNVTQVVHDVDSLGDSSFSLDGRYLAIANGNKIVSVWNLQDDRQINLSHTVDMTNVNFSPDGSYLSTYGSDGKVRVWNWSKDDSAPAITIEASEITAVAFDPKGQYLAIGQSVVIDSEGDAADSKKNIAVIWDLKNNQKIESLVHEGAINDLSFSPDSQYLATASDDKIARVWNLETYGQETRMPHEGVVNAVSFSQDGAYLATGSADKTARVWDLQQEQELPPIIHDDEVTAVSFSKDGQYLATGSADKMARVWNLSAFQGQTISQNFTDDDEQETFLSFAGIAKYAEGEEWVLQQIVEFARIPHRYSVEDVRFSIDGDKLLTRSGNKIQVVSVEMDNLIGETCKRLTRNLTETEWTRFFGDREEYNATCANLS
ncbi:toll/interleukin-1 receptor domain-containing protein [Leptothoe kymatousa]|uniref:TIR domain-containing protein n=1 Tax=Leptothoe kymatousa TAU-MAC 1615 TaxID=2364775 RepID=A0ABS5Y3K7_9CYAN|nr:TIR domain-containing protein [Leptothoe kymatousa]MBT9312410.1 TIR domain-containing protein [Leptothoe kymatousa TAU-MAC 1615]